jgi:hypothetical protein
MKRLWDRWPRSIAIVVQLLCILAASARAEAPHAQLRAFAPGGIANDWEHPTMPHPGLDWNARFIPQTAIENETADAMNPCATLRSPRPLSL